MILEFDLGNTRRKWRLRNNDEIVSYGSLSTSESFHELDHLLTAYKGRINCVWVASVVGCELDQALAQWSVNYFSVVPEFAQATDSCMGLTNGYEEPEQLGVDRWLGMITCYQRLQTAFLLVSFGTAITVDIVLKNGKHAGGFIAPGLSLMLDSLQQRTHKVVLDRNEVDFSLLPGASTTEAVYAAIAAMVKGLMENSLFQLRHMVSQVEFNVVFTGGDAYRLLPLYPNARHMPELVLDGLAYVFDNSK